MSFFNEFYSSFCFDDDNRLLCNFVYGAGVRISGNFKVDNMNEDEIVLKYKKDKVKIYGTGMIISSLARGEIEVVGNVIGVGKYEQLKN